MRKLIFVAGFIGILAAALIVIQRARPDQLPASPATAPALAPQAADPVITWSVPQLTQTMFPGATSTVNVNFKSNQNLTGVTVDITPSLNAIVSANPSNIAPVNANQTYQITLTLTAPLVFIKRSFGGTIHLKNRGRPSRTYAQPLAVELQTDWNVLTDSILGFTALFPTGVYLTDTSTPGLFRLDSSPGGVAIGGAAPPSGSSEATSGYSVVISVTPYALIGTFNVNQYLSAKYPNSVADVANLTLISIGGQPGYEFTFQNEEGGGKPRALTYHNGNVYQINYASTNYIPGFSDVAGLNAFNAVLQNFAFN